MSRRCRYLFSTASLSLGLFRPCLLHSGPGHCDYPIVLISKFLPGGVVKHHLHPCPRKGVNIVTECLWKQHSPILCCDAIFQYSPRTTSSHKRVSFPLPTQAVACRHHVHHGINITAHLLSATTQDSVNQGPSQRCGFIEKATLNRRPLQSMTAAVTP